MSDCTTLFSTSTIDGTQTSTSTVVTTITDAASTSTSSIPVPITSCATPVACLIDCNPDCTTSTSFSLGIVTIPGSTHVETSTTVVTVTSGSTTLIPTSTSCSSSTTSSSSSSDPSSSPSSTPSPSTTPSSSIPSSTTNTNNLPTTTSSSPPSRSPGADAPKPPVLSTSYIFTTLPNGSTSSSPIINTMPPKSDSSSSSASGHTIAAAVGGAVGGVLVLGGLVFGIWWCLRGRNRKTDLGDDKWGDDEMFDAGIGRGENRFEKKQRYGVGEDGSEYGDDGGRLMMAETGTGINGGSGVPMGMGMGALANPSNPNNVEERRNLLGPSSTDERSRSVSSSAYYNDQQQQHGYHHPSVSESMGSHSQSASISFNQSGGGMVGMNYPTDTTRSLSSQGYYFPSQQHPHHSPWSHQQGVNDGDPYLQQQQQAHPGYYYFHQGGQIGYQQWEDALPSGPAPLITTGRQQPQPQVDQHHRNLDMDLLNPATAATTTNTGNGSTIKPSPPSTPSSTYADSSTLYATKTEPSSRTISHKGTSSISTVNTKVGDHQTDDDGLTDSSQLKRKGTRRVTLPSWDPNLALDSNGNDHDDDDDDDDADFWNTPEEAHKKRESEIEEQKKRQSQEAQEVIGLIVDGGDEDEDEQQQQQEKKKRPRGGAAEGDGDYDIDIAKRRLEREVESGPLQPLPAVSAGGLAEERGKRRRRKSDTGTIDEATRVDLEWMSGMILAKD